MDFVTWTKRKKQRKAHEGPQDATFDPGSTLLAQLDFYETALVSRTEMAQRVGGPTGASPLVASTAPAKLAMVPASVAITVGTDEPRAPASDRVWAVATPDAVAEAVPVTEPAPECEPGPPATTVVKVPVNAQTFARAIISAGTSDLATCRATAQPVIATVASVVEQVSPPAPATTEGSYWDRTRAAQKPKPGPERESDTRHRRVRRSRRGTSR